MAKTPKAVTTPTGDKQTVQYELGPHGRIVVGEGAFVKPVDHPDTENVRNGEYAYTSEVLSHDADTGEFETLNTRYVLASA